MTKAKKYLFKRRRYGWGWTPVTWQGWAVVCVTLGLILGGAFLLPRNNPTALDLELYLGMTFLLVVFMILIAGKTSPKPKWRWGKKDTDNSDEDF